MENSGGWKTYRKFGEKPLPKNVFGPPTYDTFSPPPFLATLCHFPYKKEAPTRPTPISEASKSGFGEHTLQYVSPPPPNSRDTFSPPPQPLPNCRIGDLGKRVCWSPNLRLMQGMSFVLVSRFFNLLFRIEIFFDLQ